MREKRSAMHSVRKFAAVFILLLGPGLAAAGQPAQPHSDGAARSSAMHASRILSVDEMCSSIRRALQSSGAPEAAVPSVEQLRPALPVTITVSDSGLQLLRMDADVVPGSVRARLWTANEPAIHPFDVRILSDRALFHWLTQRAAPAHAFLIFNAGVRLAEERRFAKSLPKPVTLVFPGQTATLLLRQPDMEVRTPVMALNPGVSGQWIHVRNISTGQILAARVVGPGSLVTQF